MTRIDHFVQRHHRLRNLLHTWILVGGSLALFALCAYVFLGIQGMLFAAVFGGVSLMLAGRVSPQMVLRMYKARPVLRDEFPVGHAILDELAARAQLPARPVLYVLPSNMMNAFAVGRREESAICFTDLLLRSLSRREFAGVLAHEISHIGNQDIRVMAIADMVSRFTSALSTFGMVALFLNLPAVMMGYETGLPWIGVLLLLAAPTIGALLQLALSRTREFDADLGAAILTGDPDGLASALVKLERAQRRGWEGMVLPGGRIPDPSLLRSHPRTQDRIDRLMVLKAGASLPEPVDQAAAATERRRSPVPSIRPRWRRGEEERYSHYAGLLQAAPISVGDPEQPCCSASLEPSDQKPRIRLTRGGVYW
jgi:heat shock protein HtpX